MTAFNAARARRVLDAFDFDTLFVEELGWLAPTAARETAIAFGEASARLRPVAHLGGVQVFEVTVPGGQIPDANTRLAAHRAVEPRAREHLLLFTDANRRQTVWSLPVYDDPTARGAGRLRTARPHHFVKGQPPDLFLSKIAGITFDLSELADDGNAALTDVTARLRRALDVEQVTKKFYLAFRDEQEALATEHIAGIEPERTRRHYASVLLTRLMFVYFLQKKGFLDDGDRDYLGRHLREHGAAGHSESFYRRFLRPLFFEGFARRPDERSDQTNALLGDIRYLNGGLFLEHPIEEAHPATPDGGGLDVADAAIAGIMRVFDAFSWHLDDAPGGAADEINPDVLGYILEKYVNQKAFGAYYTPPEITGYLCDATLDRFLTEELTDDEAASTTLGLPARRFDSLADLLTRLDDDLAWRLLKRLETLSVLDPAVGSGAFLVAALKKLLTVYTAVLGHAAVSKSADLQAWHGRALRHPSTAYFLKREIITRNLYGVDLMPEAIEIAKLRLFLALVASAQTADDLEPLPNIDFNLLAGNALLGLLDVSDDALIGDGTGAVGGMFAVQEFRDSLRRKNDLVRTYRGTASDVDHDDDSGALLDIRHRIDAERERGQRTLDTVLADQMHNLGVMVQQAAWTGAKASYTKRRLTTADVTALTPFHWAYEFSDILDRGGFDVIVTNPPWDILKPNDKEFFEQRVSGVSKNKMRIEDFVAHRARILADDPALRSEYEGYLTAFPHQSAYFRAASEYAHQVAEVGGKKQSSDLNLYKLFLERCFRLLRPGQPPGVRAGHCGIVIPSGIYTDLGTKGLRGMLFEKARLTALFGFENRKLVFEDVDSRFKFVVLTFERGGATGRFPAAFMRHDVRELARFPNEGAVQLAIEAVQRLSPGAWGLMEFASDADREIAEAMAAHPTLGSDDWALALTAEFHMTNDSGLFETAPGPGRLPLWEGKLIHQFDADYGSPRYWIAEAAGRARRTRRADQDAGQPMDYQAYRLGFRDVARNTDQRTFIATLLPPSRFAGNTLPTTKIVGPDGERLISNADQLYLLAVGTSFAFDWLLRKKVTNHCNFFFVHSQPVPRPATTSAAYRRLVEISARLVCTTPAFDALAAEVGIGDHTARAPDPAGRAALRAEADARVALLYGLTEDQLVHILFHDGITGFHRVPDGVREDALAAYRALAPGHAADASVEAMIVAGESAHVEFKQTFAVEAGSGDKSKPVLHSALKTVCALLNTSGGSLLLGVADDGTVAGLAPDFAACHADNPNADGLENKIVTTLRDRLSPPPSYGQVAVSFHTIGSADVCRVAVQPSDALVRLDGEAFVRVGNTTRRLSDDEAARWMTNRAAGV